MKHLSIIVSLFVTSGLMSMDRDKEKNTDPRRMSLAYNEQVEYCPSSDSIEGMRDPNWDNPRWVAKKRCKKACGEITVNCLYLLSCCCCCSANDL
jgi:hypothetical protein